MNTNEIEFLINKAESLSSSVAESAKPAALELMRQVQLYHMICAGSLVAFAIISVALTLFTAKMVRASAKDSDESFFWGLFTGLLIVVIIICIPAAISHLPGMIAPAAYMLGLCK